MEGAAQGLANHPPLDPEVGTQVGAERILQYRLAGARAVQRELAVKGVHALDLAHQQFLAAGDGVPSHRKIRGGVGFRFTGFNNLGGHAASPLA